VATDNGGRVTIDKRLRTLEQGQTRLETDLSGLHEDFRAFTSDIKTFIADSRSRDRTPITVIVSVVGAVALIVGAFSRPYVGRLERVEMDFGYHNKLDGHPVVLARIEEAKLIQAAEAKRNAENIDELDQRVQREMRDLDATMRAEVDALYYRGRSERYKEALDELKGKP
jgi:hypothetical protein